MCSVLFHTHSRPIGSKTLSIVRLFLFGFMSNQLYPIFCFSAFICSAPISSHLKSRDQTNSFSFIYNGLAHFVQLDFTQSTFYHKTLVLLHCNSTNGSTGFVLYSKKKKKMILLYFALNVNLFSLKIS